MIKVRLSERVQLLLCSLGEEQLPPNFADGFVVGNPPAEVFHVFLFDDFLEIYHRLVLGDFLLEHLVFLVELQILIGISILHVLFVQFEGRFCLQDKLFVVLKKH